MKVSVYIRVNDASRLEKQFDYMLFDKLIKEHGQKNYQSNMTVVYLTQYLLDTAYKTSFPKILFKEGEV